MGFGRGRGKVLSHCNVCYWTFMRGEENEKEKMSWWLTTVAKIEKNGKQQKNGFGNSKRLKKTSGGAARPGKSLVRLLPYPGQKRSARNDSTP